MAVIYLLRHGQTAWNREKIFRGQTDVPLDDTGRRQAKFLAERLGKLGLHNPVILASPLQRARETADIVAGSIEGTRVESDDSFLDISYGEWEGKSREEVEKMYPSLYSIWENTPGKAVFPGGETLEKAANRAREGIFRAARENPQGDSVIVAHRAINKALFCLLLGAGMQGFWKLRQDTACLNELHIKGDTFVIVKINDTCHLRGSGKDTRDF